MAGSFDETAFAQLQNLLQLTDEAAITAQLPAAYLAQAFSMDEETVSSIMMMVGNTTGTMSMVEFVNVLMTPEMSANFDEATLQQLGMMQLMMNSTVNHVTYSYSDMAALLSMDAAQTKMLYTFYESGGKAEEWMMSVKTLVDFILANADTFSASMGAEAVGQLTLLQNIMNAADAGTEYTAKDMAVLLSMREAEVTPLYLLYISEHGNTSTWKVSAHKFVNFLVTDVMNNKQTAGAFDAKTAKQLKGVKKLIDASVSEKRYAATEIIDIMQTMSSDVDAGSLELLFMFYGGLKESNPEWTLTIEQLFTYLSEDLVKDERFRNVLGNDIIAQIEDAQEQMDEASDMLVGDNHSLMMINTILPDESAETTAFMELLEADCNEQLQGRYYFVGNSPMAFEMSKTFDAEMNRITILTALAIYVVILLTYRNFAIPLILVGTIQTAVYAIMTLMGMQGIAIYYLALIIVQSILMGSAVDYGILFTSYYREKRVEMAIKDALIASYNGSIHTFMTSGLILVVVTGLMGKFFPDPSMGEICSIISKGAFMSILLILFILPGVLAVCDKLVTVKKRYVEE